MNITIENRIVELSKDSEKNIYKGQLVLISKESTTFLGKVYLADNKNYQVNHNVFLLLPGETKRVKVQKCDNGATGKDKGYIGIFNLSAVDKEDLLLEPRFIYEKYQMKRNVIQKIEFSLILDKLIEESSVEELLKLSDLVD